MDWRQDTNCCFIAFYLRYPRLFDLSNFSAVKTEGLPHQPLQNHTIPPTFRNANIYMHWYAFTSALSLEKHYHPCLLMNALPVSQNVANRQHPCLLMNTLFVLRPAKLWAFNFGHPCPPSKKGEVLLLGLTEPTMVGDCNCLEVCFKNWLFLQPITAVFRTAVQSVKKPIVIIAVLWNTSPTSPKTVSVPTRH